MNFLLRLFVCACVLLIQSPVFSKASVDEWKMPKKVNKEYKKQIQNSVWIVPPSNLLAYEHINSSNIPVSDQTVWVINKYKKGYFFGDAYTAINGTASSQKKLVGSITPEGNVYIAFYPITEDAKGTDIISGIGIFKKKHKNYSFLMQMNSAENSLTGLAHWAFMISIEPEDYFYQHLPGLDISVPEFISQF